jgi:DNA topoisomerase VI subunit A
MKKFLEMNKKAFSVFTMYLRYQLIVQFFDKQYIITIRNIYFIEPAQNAKDQSISAEQVMVEKKYQQLFVKNASEQLTNAAIRRFNEVFGMARKAVTSD